jgi:hypothetical protein
MFIRRLRISLKRLDDAQTYFKARKRIITHVKIQLNEQRTREQIIRILTSFFRRKKKKVKKSIIFMEF